METQAGASASDANSGVDAEDIYEVSQCLAPEVTWPGIVGPELRLQTLPGNQSRLFEIAHPMGKPYVKVDGEGRSSQVVNCPEIDGDGRVRDLLEEVLAQDDVRSPRWSLWEQSSQRLEPRSTTRSHECGARRSRSEAQGRLPLEPQVQKAIGNTEPQPWTAVSNRIDRPTGRRDRLRAADL